MDGHAQRWTERDRPCPSISLQPEAVHTYRLLPRLQSLPRQQPMQAITGARGRKCASGTTNRRVAPAIAREVVHVGSQPLWSICEQQVVSNRSTIHVLCCIYYRYAPYTIYSTFLRFFCKHRGWLATTDDDRMDAELIII